jgi:hypothetical protein
MPFRFSLMVVGLAMTFSACHKNPAAPTPVPAAPTPAPAIPGTASSPPAPLWLSYVGVTGNASLAAVG